MEDFNLGQIPFVQFEDAATPLGHTLLVWTLFGIVALIAAVLIVMVVYDVWWKYEGAPRAPRWLRKKYKGLHRDDWLHYLTRIVLQDIAEWDIRGYDTSDDAFWINVNSSRAMQELTRTAHNDAALWLSGHALIINIFHARAMEPYKKFLTIDMIASRALEESTPYVA